MPSTLTIRITNSEELTYSLWMAKGLHATQREDWPSDEAFQKALKAEWKELLKQTGGTIDWDAGNGLEDDELEFALSDYSDCAPDPPRPDPLAQKRLEAEAQLKKLGDELEATKKRLAAEQAEYEAKVKALAALANGS